MTGTRITDFEAVAPFQEPPKTECDHESDGSMLLSDPPQYRCKKCGAAYRIWQPTDRVALPKVELPRFYTQADLDAAVAEAITKERRRLRHGNAKIDTAKALHLLKTGMTQVQVADALGCTPLGISKALKREGLPTTVLEAVRSANKQPARS